MSAPESPSLRSLQTAMMALLRAPDGVQAGLESEPQHAFLLRHVAGDARASAVERLDIYANMYFYRLLDSLRIDFSKVALSIGDAAFHNLVTEYLVRHPSRDPSLRALGRHVPAFLRDHALARAHPHVADLAALEWARIEVFDRRDQPLRTRDDLARHAQAGFASLELRAIDACTVVSADCDVAEVWRRLHAGDDLEPVVSGPQTLLVWRKSDRFVYHRALERDEAACVRLLQRGVSFVDLCSHLAADGPFEVAAARAFGLLSRWTSDDLLAASRGAHDLASSALVPG